MYIYCGRTGFVKFDNPDAPYAIWIIPPLAQNLSRLTVYENFLTVYEKTNKNRTNREELNSHWRNISLNFLEYSSTDINVYSLSSKKQS